MKGASKYLISFSFSKKLLSQPKSQTPTIKNLPSLRPLSTTSKTTTTTTTNSEEVKVPKRPNNRDSLILEKFRQRKLQGSPVTTNTTTTATTTTQEASPSPSEGKLKELEFGGGPTKVVSTFEELGLKDEVVEAAGQIGVWVPTEIQCVGIPAVLEGKSVVLSSDSGSGRSLAYLLPLIQLLRRDELLSSTDPKQPKAIILCATEELCDEGFRVAKFVSDFARVKSAKESRGAGPLHPEDTSDGSIGMLIGTPAEVLEQIEDGSIVTDSIKYLVLDESDAMIDHGFGPEISKIVSPLKNHKSKSNAQAFQTVLVASSITKILDKTFSPLIESFEQDNAGKVAAVMLEMDQTEVFDIIEIPDALKKKVAEAMDSLTSGS